MKIFNLSLKKLICLSLITLSSLLASCKSIGPTQVNIDRNRYNVALQETQNEELLRNIVRMRYYVPISFLQVTGVTASYTLTRNGSITPGVTKTVGGSSPDTVQSLTGTAGIFYSDTPTISYVPIASSDFINQLLTPVQLDQLSYLSYGGLHDPDLLFRLAIESFNGIDNASSASDARILSAPDYDQYYQFLKLLKELSNKGALRIVAVEYQNDVTLALKVRKGFQNDPTLRKLRSFLHIPQSIQLIILAKKSNLAKGVVGVETRSVMGMMIYLSHAVQAPLSDVQNGTISMYEYPQGQVFDWTRLMRGLMTIYTSDKDPGATFVKAQIHGHWFYIKDGDFDSTLTFTFLNNLLILTAGGKLNPPAAAPILTIPAAR